jgi:hypothetical protein
MASDGAGFSAAGLIAATTTGRDRVDAAGATLLNSRTLVGGGGEFTRCRSRTYICIEARDDVAARWQQPSVLARRAALLRLRFVTNP